jgi:hypothetical protein
MNVEQLVERKLAGETEVLDGNPPQCPSIRPKSHQPCGVVSHPRHLDRKHVTNRRYTDWAVSTPVSVYSNEKKKRRKHFLAKLLINVTFHDNACDNGAVKPVAEHFVTAQLESLHVCNKWYALQGHTRSISSGNTVLGNDDKTELFFFPFVRKGKTA